MPKKPEVPLPPPDYNDLYREWLDFILTGFNLLIRGKGSKINLVEGFCKLNLPNNDVIVVNGHFSNQTIKTVMQQIVADFELRIKLSLSANVADAKKIVEALKKKKVERYLVIHNLDGMGFRDSLALEILSVLTRGKNLRLIATLHCEWGDIYWNQDMKRAMRFVEYTVNTNESNQDEFYALNPKLAGTNGRKPNEIHTMESLDMIWTALPSNVQKIFFKLYELLKCTDENFIQFHELLDELKKEVWTLNEHLLGQQLMELITHQVIDKTEDGTIRFTVEPALLANFVDSKLVS